MGGRIRFIAECTIAPGIDRLEMEATPEIDKGAVSVHVESSFWGHKQVASVVLSHTDALSLASQLIKATYQDLEEVAE